MKPFDAWLEEQIPVEIKKLKFYSTFTGFKIEVEWDGKDLEPFNQLLFFLNEGRTTFKPDSEGNLHVHACHSECVLFPGDTFTLNFDG